MDTITYKIRNITGVDHIDEIHQVVVHQFRLGDVEDPDLYAADPLWKWQHSDKGQFVMQHAVETPWWRRQVDHRSYGYEYMIIAKLEKKKLSEYYLRWGNSK